MLKLVYRALNVLPEEQNQVLLLLGHGFFMGVFFASFQTSAETMFITRLGEEYVSWGLFSAAGFGVISTAIFVFFQNRISFSRLAIINLTGIFVITISLYLLFQYIPGEYIQYLVFIQFSLLGPLVAVFLLGFWGLFGRMFNLRQSKRIIGGIDTGQLLAAMITFFTIGVGIVQVPEPFDLLLISSVSVLLSLLFLFIIVKKYELGIIKAGYDEQRNVSIKEMASNKYVVLLASFITMSVLTYLLIENSYLSVLADQYPREKEVQLAMFVGWFNGAILVLSFVFQTFFNDRIIAQYGLRISLTILPLILGVLTIFAVFVGTFMGYTVDSDSFFYFFIIIALSKLFVTFLRDALESPAFKLYFMTLDDKIRFDIQAKIEGVIAEFGKFIAGGVILIIGFIGFFKLLHFSYLLIPALILWVIVTGRLYVEYRNRIRSKLEQQQASTDKLEILQDSVVSVLKQALEGSIPALAIFSFRLLEKINPNYVGASINALMKHKSAKVRYFAQNKMNAIRGLSVSDRYIVSVADKAEAKNRKQVSSLDIKSLFETGDISKRRVSRLSRSEEVEDRQYAAELAGNISSNDSLSNLVELLSDIDSKVRIAAMRSTEKQHNVETLNALIANLGTSYYANIAKGTLVVIGEDALKALDYAFHKSGQDTKTMFQIVQIMGRIGGEESKVMLWDKIDFPDKVISNQVLDSLSECGFRADLSQMTRIKYAIESDIGDIAWNLAAFLEVKDDEEGQLLKKAIHEENLNDLNHIYTLMSMLYDARSIQLIKQNIESGTNEGINYAVELLDVLLSEDLKQKIIPVLDEISVSERVKKLEVFYPRENLDSMQVLRFLINRDFTQTNRWSKACVIYQIGLKKISEFKLDIIANIFNPDMLIKEVAAWALFQIDEALYSENIDRLPLEYKSKLNEQVLHRSSQSLGEGTMLIEKVLFLNQMDLFNNVSGLSLSHVADAMSNIYLEEGEVFTLSGSSQEMFFIIRKGIVKFYSGNEYKGTLETGSFIGELIDGYQGKRYITLKCIDEHTQILVIEKDNFYELLSDNITFAQKVLTYMETA